MDGLDELGRFVLEKESSLQGLLNLGEEYHHCIVCGDVCRDPEMHNKIFNLKDLLGVSTPLPDYLRPYNISSGMCDVCFVNVREYNKALRAVRDLEASFLSSSSQ